MQNCLLPCAGSVGGWRDGQHQRDPGRVPASSRPRPASWGKNIWKGSDPTDCGAPGWVDPHRHQESHLHPCTRSDRQGTFSSWSHSARWTHSVSSRSTHFANTPVTVCCPNRPMPVPACRLPSYDWQVVLCGHAFGERERGGKITIVPYVGLRAPTCLSNICGAWPTERLGLCFAGWSDP
jgi:hypothetical protein